MKVPINFWNNCRTIPLNRWGTSRCIMGRLSNTTGWKNTSQVRNEDTFPDRAPLTPSLTLHRLRWNGSRQQSACDLSISLPETKPHGVTNSLSFSMEIGLYQRVYAIPRSRTKGFRKRKLPFLQFHQVAWLSE